MSSQAALGHPVWTAPLGAVVVAVTAALALAVTPDALAARKPVLTAKDVVAKESTGAAKVRFSLARPARRTVRFIVTPVKVTATQADATFRRRHALIKRGRRATVVRIALRNDALDEPTEALTLSVTGGARLKHGRRLRVTILDDDPTPRMSVVDAPPVDEGPTPGALRFMLTLSSRSAQPVRVRYQTDGGADVRGGGEATFRPGDMHPKVLAILVDQDLGDEDDQVVTLTLSAPVGAVIADGVATGVIRDDDAPPFVRLLAISPQEGDAGSQVIPVTVSINRPSEKTASVTLATEEGDGDPNLPAERIATGAPCDAGGDFEPFTDRVVMLAPGQTSATSGVIVCGDTEPERSERFRVRAVAGSNVQLGNAELIVIGDNDPEPPAEP